MKELYIPLTYKFEFEEEVKELIAFLDYSTISSTTYELDPSSGFFIVSVNKDQFEVASKLAKTFHTEKTVNYENNINLEHEEIISTKKSKLYTSSEEAYQDMNSSASAFLFIGILGIIINILSFSNIISLPIMDTTFSFIIMTGVFILFISIGLRSYQSAKQTKRKAQLENDMIKEVTDWFSMNYDRNKIDSFLTQEKDEDSQELYFDRAQVIRTLILKRQEILDETLLDRLVENFYSSLYEN
jgi:hypothetical protein